MNHRDGKMELKRKELMMNKLGQRIKKKIHRERAAVGIPLVKHTVKHV